ncbi:D-alanyl-D-alanine carboxypeptidase/D-alanyl-D-alanine-endopeptidase [candidate division WOR-3 bacterium]|nr:D-alanyl-D-alanine carboxypeptidase/D-alanyl-D-alanine-endopeptidase [candidate division WOR-3 bacterium]
MLLLLLSSLAIDSILNQPELQHAHVGMIVLDLSRDTVIYARNCQKSMVPASNVKIITSATALSFLGPEFRYKTRLAIDGPVRSGALFGDLYVFGGGDPGFTLEDIERFVTAVRTSGIYDIKGDIVLVDDYFTDERLPVGWAWHYLDARYAAEISALSLNHNAVKVRIEATAPGEAANVFLQPGTGYVKLISRMVTRPGSDSIIIFRRTDANVIHVDGAIGSGRTRSIDVAVKDPAMYFGEYLKERLQAAGIRIEGDCSKSTAASAYLPGPGYEMLDSVVSGPLMGIIKELNTESVNLYGEAIIKTLGSHFRKDGSFRAGVSIAKEFMRRCGVDTTLVVLHDGSGLSRQNLVSPYAIVLVLRGMYHSGLFQAFYDLLPGPGEGTMQTRFNGLKGSLRAKTGTLDAISCLSGYLNINGRYYCFSMMFNNFTCSRKKIESIQEAILKTLKSLLEMEA